MRATTVTLATIVACQIRNLFVCRSDWVSAFRLSWVNNPLIWLGLGVEGLADIPHITV